MSRPALVEPGPPLTREQVARYARHLLIPDVGELGQRRLCASRVAVLGAGGLGSPALLYLAAAGVGTIAVIDPDNRKFDWNMKLAFNAGLGLRIFLNRWFGVNLELRDYIFNDQLEALTVASTPAKQADPSTWLGEHKITNAVQAQLGVTIFLPRSWEYRLPK